MKTYTITLTVATIQTAIDALNAVANRQGPRSMRYNAALREISGALYGPPENGHTSPVASTTPADRAPVVSAAG